VACEMDCACKHSEPYSHLQRMARQNALAPLVERASKGRASEAEAAIKDACAQPGLFAFGELQDASGVRKLRERESHEGSVGLLDVLCYGTLSDFRQLRSAPPLSERMLTKLKQLTAASLAVELRNVPYDTLLSKLELLSDSALEDFLIDHVLTAGVITGRLNQEHRILEAHQVVPRDVRPEQASEMASSLVHWLERARNAITAMESASSTLSSLVEEARSRDEWLENAHENAIQSLQSKQKGKGNDSAEAMNTDNDGGLSRCR